jgi:hypothetical protein
MSVLPRYVIAVFFALTSFAAAGEISGIARVVDGDTLVIGERHIRLQAIDAPETDQVCLDASGERWTCGITARDRLAEHIGEHEVSCDDGGTDRYDRTLSICSLAGEDLNKVDGPRRTCTSLCAVLQSLFRRRDNCPIRAAWAMVRNVHCPLGLSAPHQKYSHLWRSVDSNHGAGKTNGTGIVEWCPLVRMHD